MRTGRGSPRVLAAMCLGTFMAILDTSLVNLGLHAIAQDLQAGLSALQWVVDGYNVAYAALLLGGGTLADLYGRRRIYAIGCALFGIGSLVCALAPNAATLILGRVVAGVGAALELPAALAILNLGYPDARERARAIGIWAAMNGLAMAIGPTLGGILVAALGWRSLFYLILPVAVLAVAMALRAVPESRDDTGRGLDPLRQFCAVGALASASLGLIEGPRFGWRSPWALVCALAFVLCAVLFVAGERRAARPLVPLDVFRRRAFAAVLGQAALMTFGMYGLLFVLPLYFQAIQHASPVQAGLDLLPMSLTFFVVSPIAGALAVRLGPRLLIGAGMALTGAGLAGLAFVSPETRYGIIAPALLAIGFGLGLITGPIAAVAVANAPPERSGMSSGLVNTGRLVGATLGVAALGPLFGGEAGGVMNDAANFMTGLRSTFLVGAAAEFLGAGLAVAWLRGASLAPESAPDAGSPGA